MVADAKTPAPPAPPPGLRDDLPTVVAISLIAKIIGDVMHEGSHAATDLLTGGRSGLLTAVAWQSATQSRLVAAAGPLVNLAVGAICWFALRAAKGASVRLRFFLWISLVFNLFDSTGYFLFSGVTNFGDWAAVIAGLPAHAVLRTLLVVGGIASYFGAVVLVGVALVRYVGVPLYESHRILLLTWFPYFSAIALLCAGGALNPIGVQLMWESALPASVGANCGLVWMKYYIPRRTEPACTIAGIGRSYAWIAAAAALSLIFIFVLGRGITLPR